MTSFLEQVENVWSGKYIATKHDKIHDILLYQIDAFFVEVYYHREKNKIRKFEPVATVFTNNWEIQLIKNFSFRRFGIKCKPVAGLRKITCCCLWLFII